MTAISLEYQYCVGLLKFAPESIAQIETLRTMVQDCEANQLYVYTLNDGSHQAALDVDYSMPGEFGSAICFLQDAAPLVHEASGEIECAVTEDTGDLSWHYYCIHENRLWWQPATLLRHPREIVTQITPADWKGIQMIGYQGQLRFPDFPHEKIAEIDHYVRQTWRTKSLQNGHIDFSYYGGKDVQRWYVQYLMGLAALIGPELEVQGEIICSMERFSGGFYHDDYEVYGIAEGHVYRHRGKVDRDDVWIAVKLRG